MTTYYLLEYDIEFLLKGDRQLGGKCSLVGFDNIEDTVRKIWSKRSYLRDIFFDDIGNGGEVYCWLSFKYPMTKLNKEAFLKNKKYYLKYPHKFIRLLEKSKEGPSLRGYVLCSDSEPLYKVLYPSYIGGNERTIYND